MIVKQLNHHDIKNNLRSFNIQVVCDNLMSPENIGLIFRICEAMGVSSINICGESPLVSNQKLLRVSRSTTDKVKYLYYKDINNCISSLREQDYTIIALEITNSSIPIQKINFTSFPNIALIIGSESKGIQHNVLQEIDLSVFIPMYGKNSSMNVVHSLAIALYEITNQLIVIV